MGKTFANSPKIVKFVNVFTLESFPYINSHHVHTQCTYNCCAVSLQKHKAYDCSRPRPFDQDRPRAPAAH